MDFVMHEYSQIEAVFMRSEVAPRIAHFGQF
jgi:hypothetical protein